MKNKLIDPSAPEPQKVPSQELQRIESKTPEFFSVYVNDVTIQSTPWDIRMTLGETEIIPEKLALNVTIVGQIRLSPQLAKRVLGILSAQLAAYEAQFGVIPGPKE